LQKEGCQSDFIIHVNFSRRSVHHYIADEILWK